VLENANEGFDIVQANVHFRLPAEVENLFLVGSADVQGYGNDLVNGVVGNTGNNLIDGGGGADNMIGGAGNDAFLFHQGQGDNDVVQDFAGNGAAPGDVLVFVGYGATASFFQVDPTHWQITYDLGMGVQTETITFANAPTIDLLNDVGFL
jgi:Ca2+-binding RTX toxin-like protein